MKKNIDSLILENILYGRVNPSIYAFETRTIPNYLKIGDTCRPVAIRLKEWSDKYPNLIKRLEHSSLVKDDIFFRDFSVHKYLEGLGFERLTEPQLQHINKDLHFSNEFFKNVTNIDILDAIENIRSNYPSDSYDYYSIHYPSVKIETIYPRTEIYEPRPNQEATIERFNEAVKNGRNKLLMYAVMRFGKSITSLWCAKKMNAEVVVIVSGKADVREEWKKNLQSHKDFINPEYVFLTSKQLLSDSRLIEKTLQSGKRPVLFFTLQDFLQGSKIKVEKSKTIKEKHKELFEFSNKNGIDLLLIDETHYGVRAKEFNKVFSDDTQNIDELYKIPKILKAKITMHLSGTPYRILMNSEFRKEDIVAFYQFSDIVDEQQKWNHCPKNLDRDEWENPYYGFPQMIRFAFNPNKKIRDKIENLKRKGITTTLSDLLKPQSIEEDTDTHLHEKFIFSDEVLDLLEVIDNKEDDEVLSFLNHPKIKEGKLCQNMVFVLPYISSCDAMERLIKENEGVFKNLKDYEIINISGHNQPSKYRNEAGILNIKKDIALLAQSGRKTITLTVNRMLTGSTVKEWDTMVYLKSGSSPQEYDQSIFRLQNPWIREYKDDSEKIIKYNMKPQTLLVDFDPNRMFIMLEEKAKIYNVNIETNGNEKLEERIQKELQISPIIRVNSHKLVEITPTQVIDYIRDYSSNRSVSDEARLIPVDLNLLKIEEIESEILSQNEIGTKGGLAIEPAIENDSDLDIPESESFSEGIEKIEKEAKIISDDDSESLKKKFATYYSRILFFAFLTKDNVKTLSNLIESLDSDDDNQRIASNLGLKKSILKLISNNINPFILSSLEYKIHNINSLSNDESLDEIERAQMAIKHFDRFSASEIATPFWVAREIVYKISDSEYLKIINGNRKILDIASKSGEFVLEIYKKLISLNVDKDKLSNTIVSIPTSNYSYEFTRKTYEILGLNVDLIPSEFNTYKLLDFMKDDRIVVSEVICNTGNYHKRNLFNKKENSKMEFDLIIGNPPYQDKGGSGGNNDAAIYQHFVNLAIELNPKYNSMIIPSRWFTAGRENLLGDFRRHMLNSKKVSELTVYYDASDVFPNVQIEGGVCHYLYNSKETFNKTKYTFVKNESRQTTNRKLDEFDVLVADPMLSNVVKKIWQNAKSSSLGTVDSIISSDTPFGVASNPKTSKKTPTQVYETSSPDHNTMLFHIENGKRKIEYVNRQRIKKNTQDIDKNKVFLIGAYGGHEQVLSNPEIAPENSICSQSYLYASFNNSGEAQNFIKYLKTKFFRTLVSAIKTTQSAPNKVYRFVPMQNYSSTSDIDWSLTIAEIDKALFKKYNLNKIETEYINDKVSIME